MPTWTARDYVVWAMRSSVHNGCICCITTMNVVTLFDQVVNFIGRNFPNNVFRNLLCNKSTHSVHQSYSMLHINKNKNKCQLEDWDRWINSRFTRLPEKSKVFPNTLKTISQYFFGIFEVEKVG